MIDDILDDAPDELLVYYYEKWVPYSPYEGNPASPDIIDDTFNMDHEGLINDGWVVSEKITVEEFRNRMGIYL